MATAWASNAPPAPAQTPLAGQVHVRAAGDPDDAGLIDVTGASGNKPCSDGAAVRAARPLGPVGPVDTDGTDDLQGLRSRLSKRLGEDLDRLRA